jgi:hypothetical protein
MAVEFTLTETQLLTISIAAETSGLSVIEKVEWCYKFTHKAANFQGKLVNAYALTNLPWVGEDIPIPQEAKDAWKANINELADRIMACQTYIADHTD